MYVREKRFSYIHFYPNYLCRKKFFATEFDSILSFIVEPSQHRFRVGSLFGAEERIYCGRKMMCCYLVEIVLEVLLKSRSSQSLVLSGVNAGGLIEGRKADSLGFYCAVKMGQIVRTSAGTVL